MRVVPPKEKTASLTTALLLVALAALATGTVADDDEKTGMVDGRVLDVHLDVVEDAIVWLVQDGDRVGEERTDPNGWYEFHHLAAGDYSLQVHHWQHESEIRSTSVQAGENTRENFALEPLETPSSPSDPDTSGHWVGFMGCSINYPTAYEPYVCPDDNNDLEHDLTVREGLKTMVVAMEWEPFSICTEDTLRHELFVPADSQFAKVRETAATSPYEYRIDLGEDFDAIEEPTEFLFRVNGPTNGVQFCYQQPFTVHYHLFYSEHAPEDYSALP